MTAAITPRTHNHIGTQHGWLVILKKDTKRLIICFESKARTISLAEEYEKQGYKYQSSCENYHHKDKKLARHFNWYKNERI